MRNRPFKNSARRVTGLRIWSLQRGGGNKAATIAIGARIRIKLYIASKIRPEIQCKLYGVDYIN